jgi:signal transduction histidine kinase
VASDRDSPIVSQRPGGSGQEDALPTPGERLFNGLVRRLSQLGLDLHDGALQDLAALRAEIELLSGQLATALRDHEHRSVVLGRMGDLTARVDGVAGELRDLAASLQPRVVALDGIRAALDAEIQSVCAAKGIEARLDLEGAIDELGAAQRETLVHFVREGLRNARQHGAATDVSVRVVERSSVVIADVVDNGRGFSVEPALERAARAGRLGLVVMSEQLRLAGGGLEISSQPGGPTVLRATLPFPQRRGGQGGTGRVEWEASREASSSSR